MKKTINAIVLAALCLNFPLKAQQPLSTSEQEDSGAVLVIKPLDSSEPIPDAVRVRFCTENVSLKFGDDLIDAELKNGQFSCHIPSKEIFTRFELLVSYGTNTIRSRTHYAQPSDRVTINIKKGTPYFVRLEVEGNGSEKYKLRELLSEVTTNVAKEILAFKKKCHTDEDIRSGSATTSEIRAYIDSLYSIISDGEARGLDIANTFKPVLAHDLIKFYTYEFLSGNTSQFLYSVYNESNSAEVKAQFADYYLSTVRSPIDEHLDHPLIKYSASYIFNKGINLAVEEGMRSFGKGLTFEQRYNGLKAIANEGLRDRLITDLFVTVSYMQRYVNDFSRRDSCLKDAVETVHEPYLKSTLHKLLVFNKGSKLPDFSFQNEAGKMIGLEDLKNKVSLIAFYGTGCTGCGYFHAKFEKDIYPEFSNNPDFQVIGVSLDGTKESWKRSMESGKYTSKHYLNLYAGPPTVLNPVFEHYQVNIIPFILLVDRAGRLIARLEIGMSSEAISLMIREALHNKGGDNT